MLMETDQRVGLEDLFDRGSADRGGEIRTIQQGCENG